jgi:hypothetical protein
LPCVGRMHERVAILNRASITKRFDAYTDVAWDELGLDPDDRRWARGPNDPLGATAWYRALPPAQRVRLGLSLTMSQLRLGIDFEAVLARGLLELASTLDVRDETFRYAYHEVIEEGQHTLMFRELIARSGTSPRGLGGIEKMHSHMLQKLARTFPELFFVFVLGGEAPIDHAQRKMLRSEDDLPPALARVVRIHVTEEARHISFAEMFLREHVPRLSGWRKMRIALRAPLVLGTMANQMLMPPRDVIGAFSIPRAVLREAYGREFRAEKARAYARLRSLFEELGLLPPYARLLWRAFGIDVT